MLKCSTCGKERPGGEVEMCTCGNWMDLKPPEKKEGKKIDERVKEEVRDGGSY